MLFKFNLLVRWDEMLRMPASKWNGDLTKRGLSKGKPSGKVISFACRRWLRSFVIGQGATKAVRTPGRDAAPVKITGCILRYNILLSFKTDSFSAWSFNRNIVLQFVSFRLKWD